MSTTVNGRRLGVAVNGRFSSSNTDPIPGGSLWNGAGTSDVGAAKAWNDARRAYISDGGLPSEFMPAGPNSSARSIAAQEYFWANRPPAAAYPGTSNHGWGLAVDVLTRQAAAWLMTHGMKYGFSHDEGARVGEWWHFRYVGGYKPKKRDGLAHLTFIERRRVRELDKLRRTNKDQARQRVLVRVLTEQRKRIWHEAESVKGGWDRSNRRKRYRSLLARTS